jgi:uncharacterized protein (TIGR03083 family)
VSRDYDRLRLDEMGSIVALLHELDDEQWDAASLCDGWRVRDVISHMCIGYTTPMPKMIGLIAQRRFNVDRASKEESIAFGDTHSPAELLSIFDRIHRDKIRKGISRVIPSKEGLVDHLTHHQDIRRPLGMPRAMPEDRLLAALEVAPGIGGFLKAKGRAKGLRFVASDIDWSWGDGPEVKGNGEAILLALGGRPSVLDELGGEGLAALRERMAA